MAWAIIVTLILRHRVFVTHDSLISYAHAWWIESHLWHGHGIPWRMPVLGHGESLTFPYGFLPWTVAALLWPVAGEWSVTLVLVLGVVGLIAATFWSFPETRRRWWAVAVLANPVLVVAPLAGEVPFLWASTLLMVGAGCWWRGWRPAAALLVGLAQLCHAAVVLPLAAALVIVWLRWEPRRRALLGWYAVSLGMAAPAVWAVAVSPVFTQSSTQTRLVQFLETVSVRAFVLAPPIVATLLRARRDWLPPALAMLTLALNVVLLGPLDARYSWQAVQRSPDTTLNDFAATAAFRPGATYRVLRSSDGKVGMYELIRHGARLDSEFFPESIWFGDFPDARGYSAFLAARRVDYVLIFNERDQRHPTNERVLLAQMAGQACRGDVVGVRFVVHYAGWDDYAIDRRCLIHAAAAHSGPGSR